VQVAEFGGRIARKNLLWRNYPAQFVSHL